MLENTPTPGTATSAVATHTVATSAVATSAVGTQPSRERTAPRPGGGMPAGARRLLVTGAAAVWALVTATWWAGAASAIGVTPAAPPGTEKLQTILNYAGWTVTFLCALGFLAVAATMALQHRRGGEGGEHVGKLGIVMGAAVLGTAAGPIITALT